jgi:hypothetical protein
METPVEIEFQDMAVNSATRKLIAEHVRKLEQRYGRVTACRIVVKGPGSHHQTGASTTSIFVWRCRMDGMSILDERQRATSDIATCRLPSMMRSSEHAGDFRITRGAWKEWSRATKGKRSAPSCDLIPQGISGFFAQLTVRRSISIETVWSTENLQNWLSVPA